MDMNEETADRNPNSLQQVASLIRPLPENVVPSEEFLRRTRVRLLKLEGAPAAGGQQAA